MAFAQREIDGGLLSGLEGEVGEREEGAEQGADSEREPPAGEGGAGVPVSMKRAAEEGGGAGSGSAGHEGWGHLDGNDDRYRGDPSRTELEVLAVVFTLVKVAFLSGRVSEAASVMPAAERMRRRAGARRPLHMTAFRNEVRGSTGGVR